MTPADHDPLLDDEPLDDDTLAVHAVVDDDATPEQRRRVARDPALVAQVTALRAAVAAVAAPVDPPGGDVLAAIRARALDTALAADDDATDDVSDEGAAEPVAAERPVAPPVRDLGAARARRARRLPPLPAVAAVVILLVLVGVGLLVSGGSNDEDQAGGDAALTAGGSDDGASGGDSGAGENAVESAGPSDDLRDRLLAASVAQYGDDDELLADLRRVDTDTLSLRGTNLSSEDTPEATTAPSTTSTLPGTDDEDATTTTTGETADITGRSAMAYAASSDVQRCDSVLRSAESDLGPVTAAVLVDVAGEPVLILRNPIEVSDQAPDGVRLTALNAIDCSPRGYAVVR